MYKVGVTGGIGSGKSTVCNIFRNLDVPVYEADPEARKIMAEDMGLRQKLVEHFGPGVFEGSVLNRKYLAARIFSDPEERMYLNKLVHPMVRDDFIRWYHRQNSAYVIEEAALLFESGAWKEMDYNILVLAGEEIRIVRIIKRDGLSRDEVMVRIKSQINPEQAAKMADMYIHNDEKKFLIPQVLEVDKLLRKRLLNKFH